MTLGLRVLLLCCSVAALLLLPRVGFAIISVPVLHVPLPSEDCCA